jgi:hypothetical protein
MCDTENTGESPSGTLSRKHATLTPKSSEIDLVHSAKRAGIGAKKESRLVNWLKRGSGSGSGSAQDRSFDYEFDDATSVHSGNEPKRTLRLRQATIVQRAKRRVEERLRRMRMKRDSTNDEHGSGGGLSRRGSMENVSNENVRKVVGDLPPTRHAYMHTGLYVFSCSSRAENCIEIKTKC